MIMWLRSTSLVVNILNRNIRVSGIWHLATVSYEFADYSGTRGHRKPSPGEWLSRAANIAYGSLDRNS